MQNVVVLAIVAAAAFMVLRQVLASRRKGCGCSGGCSEASPGCSANGGKGLSQCGPRVSPDPRDASLKSIRSCRP